MYGIGRNSIRLFQFEGIEVSVHWTWFLIAAYEINDRGRSYSSLTWNVLEYLILFLIVLLHEFGHSLACRQVGGVANQIVLWPLGGVAYVNPPPRAGATLWSIAAGPLVNVALIPVLIAIRITTRSLGWAQTEPNAYALLRAVFIMDLLLLAFNLLPIYPLDGGQIFRSFLWFVIGRARSLMVATIVGFIGAAALIVFAVQTQSVWFGFMSLFILSNCWNEWKAARAIYQVENVPHHDGFACPSCRATPLAGNRWTCGNCGKTFDAFQTSAICPNCATPDCLTACLDCGRMHPMNDWVLAPPAPVQP